MASPYDGGPAFPRNDTQEIGDYGAQVFKGDRGMSMRDYFAGKALPALIGKGTASLDDIARDAYGLADAMIAQRFRPALDEQDPDGQDE